MYATNGIRTDLGNLNLVASFAGKEKQVLKQPVRASDSSMPARTRRRGARWTPWLGVIMTVGCSGVALAPPSALADSAADFRDAVASARSATSCGPFKSDPIVEQVAKVMNRSTDDYVIHNATDVPIDDPMPGLKALGYGGNKAAALRGAAKTEAEAIHGAIVEGYAAIHGPPALTDCTYKDFGASVQYNEMKGYYLTSLVLAGP